MIYDDKTMLIAALLCLALSFLFRKELSIWGTIGLAILLACIAFFTGGFVLLLIFLFPLFILAMIIQSIVSRNKSLKRWAVVVASILSSVCFWLYASSGIVEGNYGEPTSLSIGLFMTIASSQILIIIYFVISICKVKVNPLLYVTMTAYTVFLAIPMFLAW